MNINIAATDETVETLAVSTHQNNNFCIQRMSQEIWDEYGEDYFESNWMPTYT